MRGLGTRWAAMRRWSRPILLILLALLSLSGGAVFAARPAQAQILACLNAITGYKTAVQVVSEFADPEFLQCSSQMAAGDVALIATVTAMVAAGQAGAFSDYNSCNNMITGQFGKILAGFLTEGAVGSAARKLLGDTVVDQLIAFVSDETATNIAQIEALQPIFRYLTCGCSIASKADAAAHIASGYLSDVKECGGAVAGIAKALYDGIVSGVDAVDEFLFGGDATPPPHHVTETRVVCDTWQTVLADGFSAEVQWFGDTLAQGYVARSVPTVQTFPIYENSLSLPRKQTGSFDAVVRYDTTITSCMCPSPGVIETRDIGGGQIEFRCGCPYGGRAFDSANRICQCNADERRENGECVACLAESWSETAQTIRLVTGSMATGSCVAFDRTCPAGQKPALSANGLQMYCVAACPSGSFYVRAPGQLPSQGTCAACQRNSVPVPGSIEAGLLQCSQCPAGTSAMPGTRECLPLNCMGRVDPNDPHACEQACRLEGVGTEQRLVCDGVPAIEEGFLRTCPPGYLNIAGTCLPPTQTEPDLTITLPGIDQLVRTPPRMGPIVGDPGIARTPPVIITPTVPGTGTLQTRPAELGTGHVIGLVPGNVPRLDTPVFLDLLDMGINMGRGLGSGGGSAVPAYPRTDSSVPTGPSPQLTPQSDGMYLQHYD